MHLSNVGEVLYLIEALQCYAASLPAHVIWSGKETLGCKCPLKRLAQKHFESVYVTLSPAWSAQYQCEKDPQQRSYVVSGQSAAYLQFDLQPQQPGICRDDRAFLHGQAIIFSFLSWVP
ncbi:hypothetical protein HKJ31_01990 [Xylella fastidiosa subsp. multiplex]|nr:hypothetical protein HKJ31_01990 [Xylella fastidiosa subsp. multiplex]